MLEINKKIIFLSAGGHIKPAIGILLEHTKSAVSSQHFLQIINCFELVDKLYRKGNEAEQELIIHRFSDVLVQLHHTVRKAAWCAMKRYIPAPLYIHFNS